MAFSLNFKKAENKTNGISETYFYGNKRMHGVYLKSSANQFELLFN